MRILVLVGTWIAFIAWGTILFYGHQAAATRTAGCTARTALAANHRVMPEDVACGQAAEGMFVYGRYAGAAIAEKHPVAPSNTSTAPAVTLAAGETLFSPSRQGAVPAQIDAGSKGEVHVQGGEPIAARVVAILCDPGERCAPLLAVPATALKAIAAAPAGGLRLAVNGTELPIETPAPPAAPPSAPGKARKPGANTP